MNLFQEAGFLLRANEVLRLESTELEAWADSRIAELDEPPFWLIEISADGSDRMEDLKTMIPEEAGMYQPSAEQLIAYVVEAFYLARITLAESLPIFFRIWMGSNMDFQSPEFPEDLADHLSHWDQLEDFPRIPESLDCELRIAIARYRVPGKLSSIEALLS